MPNSQISEREKIINDQSASFFASYVHYDWRFAHLQKNLFGKKCISSITSTEKNNAIEKFLQINFKLRVTRQFHIKDVIQLFYLISLTFHLIKFS